MKGRIAIEYHPLSKIEGWPRNPKLHNLEAIAGSIDRWGDVDPMIRDERTGRLVAGHGRKQALRDRKDAGAAPPQYVGVDAATGEWLVPVVVGAAWASEEEAEAFLLAHNQTTIAGGWNEALLAPALERALAAKVPVLGWSTPDVKALLQRVRSAGGRDPAPAGALVDQAEVLGRKWKTKLGQTWEVPSLSCPSGAHYVRCGDCASPGVLKDLVKRAGAPSWMWTDPPFGVSYIGGMSNPRQAAAAGRRTRLKIEDDDESSVGELLKRAFAAVDAVLAAEATLYVAAPPGRPLADFMRAFMTTPSRWSLHQLLAWVKNHFALGSSDYRGQCEMLLYGWKGRGRTVGGRVWNGGRDKSNVLNFDRPAHSDLHPTEKPIDLIAECLRNSTKPGAGHIGIDPFGGSGSTLIAAETIGRPCYVVELHPPYIGVILERCYLMGLSPKLLTR